MSMANAKETLYVLCVSTVNRKCQLIKDFLNSENKNKYTKLNAENCNGTY
jgi:hypothetical protein